MTSAMRLVELQALIAEYWASVDRVEDVHRSPQSFFTEAGEIRIDSLKVSGRGNIEAFFNARTERESANRRTTRHVSGSFRIHDDSDDRATVVTLVIVYSGCGEWPLTSAPPSAVGDFTFRCLRDPEHGWRFESVVGTSVFIGDGAPGFAKRKGGES